jgi:hypothetical protein
MALACRRPDPALACRPDPGRARRWPRARRGEMIDRTSRYPVGGTSPPTHWAIGQ